MPQPEYQGLHRAPGEDVGEGDALAHEADAEAEADRLVVDLDGQGPEGEGDRGEDAPHEREAGEPGAGGKGRHGQQAADADRAEDHPARLRVAVVHGIGDSTPVEAAL